MSAVIATAPFSPSFNYKVINVHPLSVARLTIPDGKLQLRVIPFYTRRNLLVSVQNVLAHSHVSAHVETSTFGSFQFLRLTISLLE